MEINRYIVRVSNDYIKDEEVYYVESTPDYIEEYAYNLSRDLWYECGGWNDTARSLGWNPNEVVEDSPEEVQMIEEVEFEIEKSNAFSYTYKIFTGTEEGWNNLNVIKW